MTNLRISLQNKKIIDYYYSHCYESL